MVESVWLGGPSNKFLTGGSFKQISKTTGTGNPLDPFSNQDFGGLRTLDNLLEVPVFSSHSLPTGSPGGSGTTSTDLVFWHLKSSPMAGCDTNASLWEKLLECECHSGYNIIYIYIISHSGDWMGMEVYNHYDTTMVFGCVMLWWEMSTSPNIFLRKNDG